MAQLPTIYTNLRKDSFPRASYVAPLKILHIMQLTPVLDTRAHYLHHLEGGVAKEIPLSSEHVTAKVVPSLTILCLAV